MPHISVKHFPRSFTEAQQAELVAALTDTVARIFATDAGNVSLAVEPVDPGSWTAEVHGPEIEAKAHLLWKRPNYPKPLPTEGTR